MTTEAQSAQIPAQRTGSDVSRAESDLATPAFVGGWTARRDDAPGETTEPVAEIVDVQPRSKRVRRALAARYAVYRVNRRFRRDQREYGEAMDRVAHDPAGQRELETIWTRGRS